MLWEGRRRPGLILEVFESQASCPAAQDRPGRLHSERGKLPPELLECRRCRPPGAGCTTPAAADEAASQLSGGSEILCALSVEEMLRTGGRATAALIRMIYLDFSPVSEPRATSSPGSCCAAETPTLLRCHLQSRRTDTRARGDLKVPSLCKIHAANVSLQ